MKLYALYIEYKNSMFNNEISDMEIILLKPSNTLYKSAFLRCGDNTDIQGYNDSYIFCSDRNKLKLHAKLLLGQTINDLNMRIKNIENIKDKLNI